MSEPTPGPWIANFYKENESDTGWYGIESASIPNYPGTIADTLNRDSSISPEEDAANARLLSAARDLLTMCRKLIDRLNAVDDTRDGYGQAPWDEDVRAAEELIAKIESKE